MGSGVKRGLEMWILKRGFNASETGHNAVWEIRLDVFMDLTRAGESYCKSPAEIKKCERNRLVFMFTSHLCLAAFLIIL